MPTVRSRPWPLWLGLALVVLIMAAVAWQRTAAATEGERRRQGLSLLLVRAGRLGAALGCGAAAGGVEGAAGAGRTHLRG
jgi:hypothetical protein